MGAKDWLEQKLNQGAEGDRADYASGAGADPMAQADKQTADVVNKMAAQRQANRRWGVAPQPHGDE